MIPLLGTQRTFIAFALAIALVAAIGLRGRWTAVPVLIAAALAIPVGTVNVRVLEQPVGDRILELNEGQAVHSLYRPGGHLTGRCWDGLMVVPFAVRRRPPRSIAILGNAAGTAARSFGNFFPAARVDGVEIDGELTELGYRYFDLGGPHLRTFTADARPWLRGSEDAERFPSVLRDPVETASPC